MQITKAALTGSFIIAARTGFGDAITLNRNRSFTSLPSACAAAVTFPGPALYAEIFFNQ
jgi:hypothetical protein